jgi:uncharacterized membrane protein YciS (DUF1049 family)
MIFQLSSAVVLIMIIFPIFALPALIAILLYVKVFSYFMITSRELKRIEANQRSPVISSL